ncbi:aldehyde dehydrogenase (NADP(+)) [Nitrincola sp. MINF-07-Sa-05]|uniref:aldehyde dehydrogenase (NADP(+)) n=1 Tax=Nitrincola salilacus TaxID=3400273 RepID=UPI0039182645
MTHPLNNTDWNTEWNTLFQADAGFQAINPASGEKLPGHFPEHTDAEISQAIEEAAHQFIQFATSSSRTRAELLRQIALELENDRSRIVARAALETALPEARLNGELGRTTGQLNFFATILDQGSWQRSVIDPANPKREPLPKPDLRLHYLSLGPVAVFGASNFPLAFSVAGGDTASALAAGCPVIVKAHPAHPGTSELAAAAIRRALKNCHLPDGLFALIQGSGHQQGQALVKHPQIKAVGFTGSLRGGRALYDLAVSRPEPIPFFGELGSVNPVFLLPDVLDSAPQRLANEFIASLTLGAGQFCTNPGLVLAVQSPALELFIDQASRTLHHQPAGTLLTPAISAGYRQQIQQLQQTPAMKLEAQATQSPGEHQVQPVLFSIKAEQWLALNTREEEVFGPAATLVICRDISQMKAIASQLQGQLTCTLHCSDTDLDLAHQLLQTLQFKAGRILFNGWPTGVEVSTAMIHGGPYPASTASQSTSVGGTAIERFLRPICLQNAPQALLPDSLLDPS